ncbi:nucleotide-binding universal stress UspA family protein [Blastomonas natatoria]|uniref:Nucleotide-binding universal stress UspA family protein n=1 Tax=Blastomonas natatoria TaxID=34015 RepID=A0A2V3V4D4_9SPHN|nr:universal stress protein [Blastomonas natatoria]PXW75085.1 nucleotide-binding universal stress UspA family protein [Blastomonas natatoria]
MKKSNIIIATDLSARSDRHVERGLAIAKDLDCQPVIAHVAAGALTGDGHERADVVRRLRRDFGPQVESWKIILGEGNVPEKLAEAAIVQDACLIVVGIARFNNLRDFVLGTAVDHLVRHAVVPVLVVKQGAHRPYARLAVATDFSDCSAEALKAALALFPHAKIDLISVFHVAYPGFLKADGVAKEMAAEAREEMEKFLTRYEIAADDRARITSHVIEGSFEGVMWAWMDEEKADLLVLGTQGRSGLAHAAIGSTASRLLETVPSDVLMVRKRK